MNWLKRISRWFSVPKNQKILAFIGSTLVAAIGVINKYIEDSNTATAPSVSVVTKGNDNQVITERNITGTTIHGNNIIVNTGNMYKSADYLSLQSELEEAEQNIKSYPDDSRFKQQLKKAQQKIEDFKRDVLKLAEDFSKIPINTERLRLAKQYFDTGDYQAARTILDAEGMSQDQGALLDKKKG